MKRQTYHPSTSASARSRVPRPPLPFNLPSLSKEAGASQAAGGIAATGAKWASNRPVGPDLPRHPDSRDESSPVPKAAWGGAGLRQTRPSSEFPHLSKPSSPTPSPQKTPDSHTNTSPDKSRNFESQSSSNPAILVKSEKNSQSFYPAPDVNAVSEPSGGSEYSTVHDDAPLQSSSAHSKEDENLIAAKIEFPMDDDDDDEDWADSSQQMDFLPLPVPMTDISLSPSSQLHTSTDDLNVATLPETKPTRTGPMTMFPPPAISPGSTKPEVASSASTQHLPHLSLPDTPHSVSDQQTTSADPTSLIRPSPMFPDRRKLPEPVARPGPSENVDLKMIEEQKAIMKSKAEMAHEARKRAEEERQRDLKERSARKLRELEERLRLKDQEAAARKTKGPQSILGPNPQVVNGSPVTSSTGKARDPSESNSPVGISQKTLVPNLAPRRTTSNNLCHGSHGQPPSDKVPYRDHRTHLPTGRRPRTLPPHRQLHSDGRHARNALRDDPHNPRQKVRHSRDYDGPTENETREQWLDRRRKETETKYAVRSIIDLLITRAVNGGHAAPKHLKHRRALPDSAYAYRRDNLPRASSSATRRPGFHDTHSHDKRRSPIRREAGSTSQSTTSTSLRLPSNTTRPRPPTSSMTPASATAVSVPLLPTAPKALSAAGLQCKTVTPEFTMCERVGSQEQNNWTEVAVLPPSSTLLPVKPNAPASNLTGSTNAPVKDVEEPLQSQINNNTLSKSLASGNRDRMERSLSGTNDKSPSGKDTPSVGAVGTARWVASSPVRLAPWAPRANERQPQTMRMSPMAEQRAQEAAEAEQRIKVGRMEASNTSLVRPEQSSNQSFESDPIIALPRPNTYLMPPQRTAASSIPTHSVLPGSSQAVAQSISTKIDRNSIRKSDGNAEGNSAHESSDEPSLHPSNDPAVELPPQPEGNVKVLMNPKARSTIESGKGSGRGNSTTRSRYSRASPTDGRRGRGVTHSRRPAVRYEQGRRERKERPSKRDGPVVNQGVRNEEVLHRASSFSSGGPPPKPSLHDEEESKAWANAQKGPTPLTSFDEIKRAFSNQPVPFPLAVPAMIPAVPVVTEIKSTTDSDLADTFKEEVDSWNDSGSWSASKKDIHEVRAKIVKLMQKASASRRDVEDASVSKGSRDVVNTKSEDTYKASGKVSHRHTESRESEFSDPNSSFERVKRTSQSNRQSWGTPSNCFEQNSTNELRRLLTGHGPLARDSMPCDPAKQTSRDVSKRADYASSARSSTKEEEISRVRDVNIPEVINGLEDRLKSTHDLSVPVASRGRGGHSTSRYTKAPGGSRGRIRRSGPGRIAPRDTGQISNHHTGLRNAPLTERSVDHSSKWNAQGPSDSGVSIQTASQLANQSQTFLGRAGSELGSNSRRDRGKRTNESLRNGRKFGQRGRPDLEKGQGVGGNLRRNTPVDGGRGTAGTKALNTMASYGALSTTVVEEDSVEISKEDDDGRINVVLNSSRGRDGRGGRRRGFGSRGRGRGGRGRGRGGGPRAQGHVSQTTGTATVSQPEVNDSARHR